MEFKEVKTVMLLKLPNFNGKFGVGVRVRHSGLGIMLRSGPGR